MLGAKRLVGRHLFLKFATLLKQTIAVWGTWWAIGSVVRWILCSLFLPLGHIYFWWKHTVRGFLLVHIEQALLTRAPLEQWFLNWGLGAGCGYLLAFVWPFGHCSTILHQWLGNHSLYWHHKWGTTSPTKINDGEHPLATVRPHQSLKHSKLALCLDSLETPCSTWHQWSF